MEALTSCDIIACEDTRKTGKLLELIFQKRMKDRFKTHFGTNFESFMDEEDKFQQEQNQASDSGKNDKKPTDTNIQQQSHSDSVVDERPIEEMDHFFSTDKDEMVLHRLQWANS